MNKKAILTSTILLPICSNSLGSPKNIKDFYIVKEGESFSKIAEKMRFDYKGWSFKKRFESLLNENPQISDVNKVFPGDKIALPQIEKEFITIEKLSSKEDEKPKIVITKEKPKLEAESKIITEVKEVKELKSSKTIESEKDLDKTYELYYVRKGETLSQIAQKVIGRPVFDKKIGSLQLLLRYNLQIKSPDNISVGDKIFIPSSEEIELYRFLKTREAKAKKPILSPKKSDLMTSKPSMSDYLPENKKSEKSPEKVWVKKLLQGDDHLKFLWCSPNC